MDNEVKKERYKKHYKYELDPERAEVFWYYMNERQRIYLKKEVEKAPWPWTEDKILQKYSFTNVFRENDRTTRWINDNVLVPYADHPNLWFMSCVARQISRPNSIKKLIEGGVWPLEDEWDFEGAAKIIDDMIARGETAWTGAFMIRAESDSGAPWYNWSKARYVFGIVLGNFWNDRKKIRRYLEKSPTYEGTVTRFNAYYGIGPFMAKEFANDLLMSRYLRDAPDLMDWSAAGPGAIKGLNYLHRRSPLAQITQKQARKEMKAIQEIANGPNSPLGDHIPKPLCLERIQWNLCEFQKYFRTKLGSGTPRSKYRLGKHED